MWSSSYFCGSFVGPTLGGVLVETYGFPATAVFYAAVVVLIALTDCFELAITGRKKQDYKLLR